MTNHLILFDIYKQMLEQINNYKFTDVIKIYENNFEKTHDLEEDFYCHVFVNSDKDIKSLFDYFIEMRNSYHLPHALILDVKNEKIFYEDEKTTIKNSVFIRSFSPVKNYCIQKPLYVSFVFAGKDYYELLSYSTKSFF